MKNNMNNLLNLTVCTVVMSTAFFVNSAQASIPNVCRDARIYKSATYESFRERPYVLFVNGIDNKLSDAQLSSCTLADALGQDYSEFSHNYFYNLTHGLKDDITELKVQAILSEHALENSGIQNSQTMSASQQQRYYVELGKIYHNYISGLSALNKEVYDLQAQRAKEVAEIDNLRKRIKEIDNRYATLQIVGGEEERLALTAERRRINSTITQKRSKVAEFESLITNGIAKVDISITVNKLASELERIIKPNNSKYMRELVIVPHSQGNFYVESAYALLMHRKRQDLLDRIRVVGVAPVAATTPNRDYISIDKDIAVHFAQDDVLGRKLKSYKPLEPNYKACKTVKCDTVFGWLNFRRSDIVGHNFNEVFLSKEIYGQNLNDTNEFMSLRAILVNKIQWAQLDLKKNFERTVTITPSKTDVSLGETITLKVTAVWDGVKTMLVSIGDKVVEILGDFGAAISHLFSQTGDQEIKAELRDQDGYVLGNGAATVTVEAIELGSITPSQVMRTVSQAFVVTGERIPAKLSVDASNGICSAPLDITSTGFRLTCRFEQIGDQTITVRNADTQQVVGSAQVAVQSNVTAVKWGINNGTVRFGDTVTYTVEGVNLTSGMGFAVENCGPIDSQWGIGTDIKRTFQCWFNPEAGATAGQKFGVVADKPQGQRLFQFAVPVEVVPATGGGLLTATGITTCGYANYNDLPCTKEALGDLHGLGQDGEVQAGQKMSYTVLNRNGAECVQDNVTGLIWEQKTDDNGLRDKDWTYTWYNPDANTNGGHAGTQNGGTCFNRAGGAQCDTAGYVAALNAANYCGYSDWRMPTRMELINLLDYGYFRPNPVFITGGFWYWSASPYAALEDSAWIVNSYNHGGGFQDYEATVSLGDSKEDGGVSIRAVRTGHEK